MKKYFLILICSLFFAQATVAQTSSTSSFSGVRRGLATVMFAGLGGAVLGLSTLSFYGEPQDHIGNIWTGLALGVIGGTAYVFAQSQRSASTALEIANPHPKVAMKSHQFFQYTWEF